MSHASELNIWECLLKLDVIRAYSTPWWMKVIALTKQNDENQKQKYVLYFIEEQFYIGY